MAIAVNRDKFSEKLHALIGRKREDYCFYFSEERYSKITFEVIKSNGCTPLDYRRLKRFDILNVSDEEKLILPLKPGETNIEHYVTNDELFDTFHTMWKPRQIGSKTLTFEMIEEKKILKIEDMSGNEVYLGWESVSEVWSLESVLRYRLSYSSGSNLKYFYEDKYSLLKKMWMLYAQEHWTKSYDLKSAVERLYEELGALEFDADHEAIYGMERYYTVQQCEELRDKYKIGRNVCRKFLQGKTCSQCLVKRISKIGLRHFLDTVNKYIKDCSDSSSSSDEEAFKAVEQNGEETIEDEE
ncbi:hypothetical protein FQA39_LY17674 [Lamprigera yunnana]|nr:hypothetical protein FQA39_LY17674 [Lamprigera yunnana]